MENYQAYNLSLKTKQFVFWNFSFENNVLYLHDRLCVLEFNSLAIILIVNNPACFQVLAVFTPYIEWGKKRHENVWIPDGFMQRKTNHTEKTSV